jgi:hypothetical protein
MRNTRWFLIAIGLGALSVFAGCDKELEQARSKEVLIRSNVSYADPAEQKQFREALTSASIPHEVSVWPDGKEYGHGAAIRTLRSRRSKFNYSVNHCQQEDTFVSAATLATNSRHG